jgi:hypothetical protein
MRRFLFVGALAAVAGCESTAIVQTDVSWMDWPADVVAGVPFTTRLVVGWRCGAVGFRPGASVDLSAVTFEPYFIQRESAICALAEQTTSIDVIGYLDTAGVVPGLSAAFPRTYEMRAAAGVGAYHLALGGDGVPIRTYGEVTVRLGPDPALSARRNAAGEAYQVRDDLGCLRMNPSGLYGPRSTFVIENPDDTTTYRPAFVRGYIYKLQAPLCGDSTVFHLVSRN